MCDTWPHIKKGMPKWPNLDKVSQSNLVPALIASANKQIHLHPKLLFECIFLLHPFVCTLFQKVKVFIWEKYFLVKMDFELLSIHWFMFESKDWILKYLWCIINFNILLHAKMEICVMERDKKKADLMVKWLQYWFFI